MAANTQAPFGLRSFGHRDGMPPTMGLERFFMNSSDTSVIGTGDVVVVSTGTTNGSQAGFVTQPSTTSATPPAYGYAGVFNGCEFYNPAVARTVWSSFFPASVGSSSPVIAYVISDPQMLFLAQCSSASIVGTSNIGMNIGINSSTLGAANTTTGVSGLSLASSQISALSSFPFRIVDLYGNLAPGTNYYGVPGANQPALLGINGIDTASAGQWIVVAPNNWGRVVQTGVST